MDKQGTSSGRWGKTANVVDHAHQIRRRMRDLREPEATEEVSTGPRFLLFKRIGLARSKDGEAPRGAEFWYVLSFWLVWIAIACAIVFISLHAKRHFLFQ